MTIKEVYERYKHLDDAKIFDLDVETMDFGIMYLAKQIGDLRLLNI